MGAHGEIEITITADKAQAAIDALASHANKGADRIASHERQVMSQLALERKRFVAEGLANEVAALDQVVAMRKKAYDYKSQGFSQERATGMAKQEVLYDTEIAAKQKAVELAKNIETSQSSLNAQKLRELETAKQIAEKQASIALSNAKDQAAIQKKIQLMAAVASGDKQREQHLRAMADLERNVQLGLNAGLKPSEALQQARTMLRLEQSISQEKQKQQSIGGGPGGAAYSGARRGSAFSGGQNAAYRTGMISQQAQDVAVSLQMGMSASRVIAQQGSQIASIFGPKGMVIGGVIAIGAAIAEWAFNTKAAEAAAEKYKKTLDDVAQIRKETAKTIGENQISRTRLTAGDYAADEEAAAMKLALKNKELNDKQKEINEAFQNAPQSNAEERRKAAYDRNKGTLAINRAKQVAAEEANLDKIARDKKMNADTDAYAASAQFAADMEDEKSNYSSKATDRKNEDYAAEYQFKKELAEIDKSALSEANKQIKRNALENKYAAEGAAEDRKRANDDQAEKSKSELEGAENLRKSNEEKIDIEKKAFELREKESAYGKAQTDTQKKLIEYETQRYEIAQKRRYGLITEAQAAAQLHAVNQQQAEAMIQQGMGPENMANARGRAERKAAEAFNKAFKKSEDKMGLTGIARGVGGEIISGVDPATGQRIMGQQLKDRAAMMAEARNQNAQNALNVISDESIGKLTASIEKLLAK